MKKIIIIAATLLLATLAVSAKPRAIGLRLGYGASITYQHSISEKNFLSFDLDALGFKSIGGTITYDWLNPFNANIPWNKKGAWNWYLGAGASAGAGSHSTQTAADSSTKSSNAYAGITGRCGIEYEFWFPLQLALELRPTFGTSINNTTSVSSTGTNNQTNIAFFADGLLSTALNLCVRYRF